VLALPVIADQKSNWLVYHAASFDVSYPANFTVLPSLKSSWSAQRYDSVYFVSPDAKIKFYATTNTEDKATDIALQPAAETLVSTKTEKKNAMGDNDDEYELYRYTWKTIRAKDRRYIRALVIVTDGRDYRKYDQAVIGIQYADDASYQQYRKAYLHFKDSLKARIYYGGSISVVYPAGFTARPSLRNGDTRHGSVLSVFFTVQDNKAEFYVFSPWTPAENATDYQLRPDTEVLISESKKDEHSSFFDMSLCTVTRQRIRAKDESYTRIVLDIKQKDDISLMNHLTFGFKYRDQQTYIRYAEDFQMLQKVTLLRCWD